jgi:lantibiotic biosynthesis protein
MDWRPILVGAAAERALRVVDEIAVELAACEAEQPGLASGAAGLALFFACYGDVTGDERAYDRATALLEHASGMLTQKRVGPSLADGIAGIGWTIEHLSGDPDSQDDANRGVELALAELVQTQTWNGLYDLISGAAGFSIFALERVPRPGARRLMALVVEHLERTAVVHDGRCTWHTPARSLPEWQARMAPQGYYNLGLAHGVPALVAILAKAAAAGIDVERARALVDDAVEWLLAHRIEHPRGRFTSWLAGTDDDRMPARTAWCYGDPGVACALLTAGRALHVTRWQEAAIDLMRGVAARAEDCVFQDAALCHGAFGVALALARFYHATDDDTFRRAANVLFERGMAMRRPDESIAGFAAYDGPNATYVRDPGFLTGAAGIGLALLAFASDQEPSWDRVLLFT